MKKGMRTTLALVMALLLIGAQMLTATAATNRLPSSAFKIAKDNDGALHWKMTNKQFVSAYNATAKEPFQITNYKNDGSFVVSFTQSVKLQVFSTADGYVKKIVLKDSFGDDKDEQVNSEVFANVLLNVIVTMSQEDNGELKRIFEKMDTNDDTLAAKGKDSSIIVRNGVSYKYSVSFVDDPGVEFVGTPTTKANTK